MYTDTDLSLDLRMNLFLTKHGLWNSGKLSDMQRELIKSCLIRGDIRQANIFISDWKIGQVVRVSKWVPGDHFYVGSAKFNTHKEASEHIRSLGLVEGSMLFRYARMGELE